MGAKDFLFFLLLSGSLGMSVYTFLDLRLEAESSSATTTRSKANQVTAADMSDLAARIDELHGRFDALEQEREAQPAVMGDGEKVHAALDALNTRVDQLIKRMPVAGGSGSGGADLAASPAVSVTKQAVIEAYKQIEQDKVERKIAKKRKKTIAEAAKSIDELAQTVDITEAERQALLDAVEAAFDQKAELKKNAADDPEAADEQAKDIDLQLQRDIESILGPDRYEEVYLSSKREDWRREDERTARAIDATLSRFGKERGMSEQETRELQETIANGLSRVYELQRRSRPTRYDPTLETEIKQAAASLESDLRARLGDDGFQQLRKEYEGNMERLQAEQK